MAMSGAQEAGIIDITCSDTAFEVLAQREGMPELPHITLLRANSFKDTNLTKKDTTPYFSAQDLSEIRPTQEYEKAALREAKQMGGRILEITVLKWDEADLAGELVMALYRERANADPISLRGLVKALGRIANQNVKSGETRISNNAEQYRGTNINIAQLYKPYQLVRATPTPESDQQRT